MGVAFLALVIALGGTSYAVTKIDPRSVGSRELKKSAVGKANIKRNAVTGAKVAANAIKGDDVDEGSLGQVPLAATAARATTADRAASAGTADRAGAAGALDRVVYRTTTATLPRAPGVDESSLLAATARCDAGQLVVGGGARVEEGAGLVDSYPEGAAAWTVTAANDDPTATNSFTVFAICISAGAPG